MSKLITVWKYIRQHKYLITILVFLLVVVFLDENSLMKRAQYRQEISTLKSEIPDTVQRGYTKAEGIDGKSGGFGEDCP